MNKSQPILGSSSYISDRSSGITTNSHTSATPSSLSPDLPSTPEENSAAIKIQRLFRGCSVRKDLLPSYLHPQYAELCKNIQDMEKADQGKSDVYLPKGHRVVLKYLCPKKFNHYRPTKKKEIARVHAIRRFQSTHQVRAILREIKASHLVIPKSYLCKDFLVEERLPIVSKSYECSQLYWNNLPKFVQPVKEMVRLFSKINIPGLVEFKRHRDERKKLSIQNIRYDNMPFLEVNEKNTTIIKIGLIDLERAGEENEKSMKSRLNYLAMIFPYHKDLIKEEAKQLELPYDNKTLEKASQIGIGYLLNINKTPSIATARRP